MPDAYVHIRTARAALLQSGATLPCPAAYEMGANGPDPFFSYKVIFSHPEPNLPDLAQRLHREKAGEFLTALVTLARGGIQRSFAAGFVLHNTLDSLAHPYVAALCEVKGAVYDIPSGHCFYEAALDCAYYRADTGAKRAILPMSEVCPVLSPAELGEISALLQRAIFAVFGQEIPFLAISDSYRWFYWMHRFFPSRFGAKKLVARLADALLRKPGFASSHMQPRKMKPAVPEQWENPYTGAQLSGGMPALLTAAEATGALRIGAMLRYWHGDTDRATLAAALGNASYDTGLPC